MIKIKNGKLLNYTYDYDGDGKRDASSSIPMGKLLQLSPGDTETSIKNGLNEKFENARIDMRVPGKVLNLVADSGTLVRKTFDGTFSIYSIRIDLPANSTINIKLVPENITQ